MDKILINDLQTRCIIGVNADERREKQDVLINLALSVDLRTPGRTDAITDTVNYSTLKKRILADVETSQYFLLEALAERIADLCLAETQITQVTVRVEKPTALRFARSVGVEIVREKEII